MKKLLAVCTTALQALGLARGGNSAPSHAPKRVRIIKPLAVITTAILATGLAVVGVAAPASAHTQSVTSTCSALTVNLTNYAATVSATNTTYKSIPNPDYVPAATVTTYQRYSWTGHKVPDADSTPVNDPENWQKDNKKYDNSPVGQQLHQGEGNGSWFYWVKTDTVTPAVGTPTIQVVDHQGTPQKTNHVIVTIDGAATPVVAVDFSTTYNSSFNFASSTESHSWKIVVTAWDDPTGSSGWTKTITGSSTACAAPTFTVSQCTSAGQHSQGSYYIPSTSGVKYYVSVNGGQYSQKSSNTTYYPSLGQVITVQARSSSNSSIVYVTYPSVTFANPGACLIPAAEGTVSASPQTCTASTGVLNDGSIAIPVSANVKYYIDGSTTPAAQGTSVPATVGSHTIDVVANVGYILTGQGHYTVNVAAHEGVCLIPLAIDTDPSASSCTNTGNTDLASWIFVDLTEGVVYKIDNAVVTQSYTAVTAAAHVVTAEAAPGYTLVNSPVHEWTLTPVDTANGCLATGGTATPAVTQAAATCSAAGSYTLSVEEPELVADILWTVDGRSAVAGTYTAAAGTTVHVVATAVEGTGISGSETGSQEWTITIAAPAADCAQLKTLAFTGADGSMGGMLIFALFLLLGGAGVYTAGRLRSHER